MRELLDAELLRITELEVELSELIDEALVICEDAWKPELLLELPPHAETTHISKVLKSRCNLRIKFTNVVFPYSTWIIRNWIWVPESLFEDFIDALSAGLNFA